MQTNTWISIPVNSDFTLQNLPFGIFCTSEHSPSVGVAIGEYIVDMEQASILGVFGNDFLQLDVFAQPYLNDFMALGRETARFIRKRLTEELTSTDSLLYKHRDLLLVPMSEAQMLMPVYVRDYTDFYSSIEHATNVGKLFRPDNPLLPNWKHLPIAYHGRASSIVVSGTDFPRPKGQMMPPGAEKPQFGPSKRMDFELETAFIVGKPTDMGDTVAVSKSEEYIFGFVLFNDWSARDIQSWEYQPLGPFLGKNFASSVSPWVVTLDALEPFRTETPAHDVEIQPYLQTEGLHNFDISLEVSILPEGAEKETVITRSNMKHLYWSAAQQLAHHTVNGCNINIGDMMASGTISAPYEGGEGSLLELTLSGKKPLQLADGQERTFLLDGDTVIMRGFAEKDGVRVGFGEVRGKINPAL